MRLASIIVTLVTSLGLALGLASSAAADSHGDAPAEEAAPAGSVARAGFTTGVENREPVDDVTTLGNEHGQVYFFTELVDLGGQTIVHRWERDGAEMAAVRFQVGGPRWRVWSTKELDASWTGDWTVSVVDGEGRVLETRTLTYSATPAPPPGE